MLPPAGYHLTGRWYPPYATSGSGHQAARAQTDGRACLCTLRIASGGDESRRGSVQLECGRSCGLASDLRCAMSTLRCQGERAASDAEGSSSTETEGGLVSPHILSASSTSKRA
eukprot:1713363-Rhodomonas_salina.2